MVTKQFSNPQALSSALAELGTLQPQAIGLLNCLVPIVLVSNYNFCNFVIYSVKHIATLPNYTSYTVYIVLLAHHYIIGW